MIRKFGHPIILLSGKNGRVFPAAAAYLHAVPMPN
jgi:hypothetical protein